MNAKLSKKLTKTNVQHFVLFFPGFFIFFGLIILSIFLAFYYSFFNWDGLKRTMDFVGFTNYIRALKNSAFMMSLRVTFFYAIFGTVITTVIALTLSSFLNKKSVLTNFYRSAFFFPQLISLVAVGFIFKALLSYIGIVNTLLESAGLSKINFLADPALAQWTILFISVWQTTGFATVLYLAGLQAIPTELYDSAKIDGANSWKKFRYITFPWLAPSFTAVTVFLFTGYMRIFDIIYVLTSGGPAGKTESVAIHIIRIGFNQFRISYASAIAMYMLILVSVIALVLTNILRKRENDLIS
ncbi:MAG: sugar ABC transporter permease [Spirochaetales bacterium]|jgi:ABC-type sugar transport system permease subunit|nr:sugar ABC transporter permease [Spirochaetales bacterium]